MTIIFKEPEKRFIDRIQRDFPLVSRPYQEMGRECGLSESYALDILKQAMESRLIREISGIFDPRGLGYKSTLAALKGQNPDGAAERINRHPGVSHNYLRKCEYNLWFTLNIPKEGDFNTEIQRITEPQEEFIVLPALRTFKIGVHFSLSQGTSQGQTQNTNSPSSAIESLPVDPQMVRVLQEPLEIIPKPWEAKARMMGKSEEAFLTEIRRLKRAGIIKRISAVLRHRKAGFSSNGMTCFSLAPERVVEAGKLAATFPQVSHCYQRTALSQWPYSLYIMTHAREEEESRKIIHRIAGAINCPDYITLYSIKEYKKERVKYFLEGYQDEG